MMSAADLVEIILEELTSPEGAASDAVVSTDDDIQYAEHEDMLEGHPDSTVVIDGPVELHQLATAILARITGTLSMSTDPEPPEVEGTEEINTVANIDRHDGSGKIPVQINVVYPERRGTYALLALQQYGRPQVLAAVAEGLLANGDTSVFEWMETLEM